eukprot:TRINITY_DN617_c4_g1_i1.p1 TRINITY_DN617_c4_g1~~TRINITY_DN617_c4_g1_i1.p1  ORF type:complete len:149 (+),score=37.73 TRINITY_DN617_c4_g1_i1:25-471(+)
MILKLFNSLLFIILSLACLSLLKYVNCDDNVNCGDYNGDCNACTTHSQCVYCLNSNTVCTYGNIFGPTEIDECDGWRWGQCTIDGVWVVVSLSAGIALVIIMIILSIVIAYCCCYVKKHKKISKSRSSDFELLLSPPQKETQWVSSSI